MTITKGEYKTDVSYRLVYEDRHGNGFGFPCDAEGVVKLRPEAVDNYEYCKANADKFEYAGIVRKYVNKWREPDRGTCHCGYEVELINQYMGACQCPNCGQWYNLFGTPLLPPNEWETGDDW